MIVQETYHYINITRVPNNIYKVPDSAFTENAQYVYPRLQHKPSVALEIHQLPALAFRSR